MDRELLIELIELLEKQTNKILEIQRQLLKMAEVISSLVDSDG